MYTRIMAVALLVVGFLGVRAAQGQESVTFVRVVPTGAVPEDTEWSNSPNTTIIVIGGSVQPITFPASCGGVGSLTPGGVETVTTRLFSSAGFRITEYVLSSPLSPGDRITNFATDAVQCCLDDAGVPIACTDPLSTQTVRTLAGTIEQPASAGSALFSSPVELDSDAIGVVTGQPNDDGTYKVIFKKQGSPAQQVDIATDDVLLAADVLRDLIDLGCDDDTGEHLYLAEIEW